MKLLRYNQDPVIIPKENITGVIGSGKCVITVYTIKGDFTGHTLVED